MLHLDEKTIKDKLEEARKRLDYRRKIINQTNIRTVINLLGKNDFIEMLEHISDMEDIFDMDEGCGIISCRKCGACGINDYNMIFTAINGSDKKQMVEYEDQGTEHEVKKLYWNIECRICGESWAEFLKLVS